MFSNMNPVSKPIFTDKPISSNIFLSIRAYAILILKNKNTTTEMDAYTEHQKFPFETILSKYNDYLISD
jgi:hypothetical protein